MATTDPTSAYAVAHVTLTPAQARHVARYLASNLGANIAGVAERQDDDFITPSEWDTVDLMLEAHDVAIHINRQHVEQLKWGEVTEPITLRWQRNYAEDLVRRLMLVGAEMAAKVGDTAIVEKALEPAEAGAAILDQLDDQLDELEEATR